MSISSTGLYGSATIVNSELFNDVEDLKKQVTAVTTSYLTTTLEHRNEYFTMSINRIKKIEDDRTDLSNNRTKKIEVTDVTQNTQAINDVEIDIINIIFIIYNLLINIIFIIYNLLINIIFIIYNLLIHF
jgi:hypothetical protein